MWAHSVKNPGTKHYFIYESDGYGPTGKRCRRLSYLCNSASSTTPSKRTRVISEVTCLNCLRELRKRVNQGQGPEEMTIESNLKRFLLQREYKIAEDMEDLGLLRGMFVKIIGRKPLGYCRYHGTHGGEEVPEKCPEADK